MDQAKWQEAISLINKGIEIAESKKHPGTVNQWQNLLVVIAEKSDDKFSQRKLNRTLFFDNRYQMSYYQKLKSTYEKTEWEEISSSIIARIKTENNYATCSALANIYVEEKQPARLMEVIASKQTDLNFVDHYQSYLPIEYHERLIEIYSKGIERLARNTGRSVYKEVSSFLSKLKNLESGQKQVEQIIANFRVQYKMRPAMIEILDKNFPETIVL